MEISEGPDTYVPKMDASTKLYCDQYVYNFTNGIICPCTPTKTFHKRESFQIHWKSNKHKKWIQHLNDNATNYYKECIEQEKTIKTQQIILTKLENELKQKDTIIHYLETSLHKPPQSLNLLEFD